MQYNMVQRAHNKTRYCKGENVESTCIFSQMLVIPEYFEYSLKIAVNTKESPPSQTQETRMQPCDNGEELQKEPLLTLNQEIRIRKTY